MDAIIAIQKNLTVGFCKYRRLMQLHIGITIKRNLYTKCVGECFDKHVCKELRVVLRGN